MHSRHSSNDSPNQEFYFERDENVFLWLLVRGILVNEGKSIARVRLDGEAEFIEGTSPLYGDEPLKVPPPVGAATSREHLLRPGEAALFEWGYGHTLVEWADAYKDPDPPNPKGACFLTVTVFDFHEPGMIDHIYIEMAGRPIEPIPGKREAWHFTQTPDTEIGSVVYPNRRTYRHEPSSTEEPPWVKVYAAASKAR